MTRYTTGEEYFDRNNSELGRDRTCQRLRAVCGCSQKQARPHPARGLAAVLTRIRLGQSHQTLPRGDRRSAHEAPRIPQAPQAVSRLLDTDVLSRAAKRKAAPGC